MNIPSRSLTHCQNNPHTSVRTSHTAKALLNMQLNKLYWTCSAFFHLHPSFPGYAWTPIPSRATLHVKNIDKRVQSSCSASAVQVCEKLLLHLRCKNVKCTCSTLQTLHVKNIDKRVKSSCSASAVCEKCLQRMLAAHVLHYLWKILTSVWKVLAAHGKRRGCRLKQREGIGVHA